MVLAGVLLCWLPTGRSEQVEGIVSLDLCTDWMLLSYARRSQVLAFSPLLYRDPPSWVEPGLPTHDGSLEQLISLAPTRVISGEYNAIQLRRRLVQLGFDVTVLALPQSLQQVVDYQRQLLQAVGRDPDVYPLPQIESKPRLERKLLLLGANGMGTGRGTLEHELMTGAGWDNYLQHEGYVSLPMEKLVVDPPDAIYWSGPAGQALANLFIKHPVIGRMGAQILDDADHWRWRCPGPWTWQLLEELSPLRLP